MSTATLIALLSLFPANSPAVRLISAQRVHVASVAEQAATEFNVPLPLLYSVGFLETWCGTHPDEGGGWGAPRPGQPNRHIAGTARDAARILARGLRECGTWFEATARFRSGDCRGNHVGDNYATRALHLAEQLHRAVGSSLPLNWRTHAYASGR